MAPPKPVDQHPPSSQPIPVHPPPPVQAQSAGPRPQATPTEQQQQQRRANHGHPGHRGQQNPEGGHPGTATRAAHGSGGQKFGQYVIIKTLGEGSFGKVKLAVHQATGQKVALKIISRRKLINKDMAGRVEREIQYLQLLRHPHIIKLYNVVTTNSEIVMVIEYAGKELFDYIVTHGRMSEDSARRFFQQIICAVEYCHRHKIVHRDLKPENLLLDEFLNVKIADFGLSNIMTDGNFLKTSCGSPNYAAPEVISGKLYAGPEVDVWSCGVILYVLLCGRLPFDDDYIPTLFKKISQGIYSVPSYLSSEAVALLRKMLVVNPVNRITVAEIRQDPWFSYNLPDYLRPAEEEFIDTGVDPAKHPHRPKTTKAAGELHDAVVGKLKKTMGYGNDDVHEALGKEEPNAIKDAYMIVRENTMMMRDSRLSNAQNIQSFLAQSPPAWNSPSAQPGAPTPPRPPPGGIPAGSSPFLNTPNKSSSPLTLNARDALGLSADEASSGMGGRSPNSSICILPTSLPEYHRAYMSGGPRPAPPGSSQQQSPLPQPSATVSGSPPQHHAPQPANPSPLSQSESVTSGSSSGQRRSVRPLTSTSGKPQPSAATAPRPEPLTPLSNTQFQQQMIQRQQMMQQQEAGAKKPKPTRWQFGIRSRNPPLEAVSCIYRALKKLGAEWVTAEDDDDGYSDEYDSYSGSESGSQRGDSDYDHSSHSRRRRRSDASGTAPDEDSGDGEGDGDSMSSRSRRRRRRRRGGGGGDDYDEQQASMKPPEDPWVIHCRWRKDGMYPGGGNGAGGGESNRSSVVGQSVAGSSAASSLTSAAAAGLQPIPEGQLQPTLPPPPQQAQGESVYVHMEIQLYKLENHFYLVDFKCAGYERIEEEEEEEYDDEEYTDDEDGDGSGEDEYEYDDGIAEPGYEQDPEDVRAAAAAAAAADEGGEGEGEGEGGSPPKRGLVVVNPDGVSTSRGGTSVSGGSVSGRKKTVGFADEDAEGEGNPAASATATSTGNIPVGVGPPAGQATTPAPERPRSDDGHHHHHHHHHHHSHHHGGRGGSTAGDDEGGTGGGRKPQEDKDVTSPFPFLDLATKLIIQLAEAD